MSPRPSQYLENPCKNAMLLQKIMRCSTCYINSLMLFSVHKGNSQNKFYWMSASKWRGTYFPHHKSSFEVSSFTTRLSLGDRPVLAPDSVASAPVDVMYEPFSNLIACSYNSVKGQSHPKVNHHFPHHHMCTFSLSKMQRHDDYKGIIRTLPA